MICMPIDFAKWQLRCNKLPMASANQPCGAVIVYLKFLRVIYHYKIFIVMRWENTYTLAPQFLGWRVEGKCLCLEKFLNKLLMVWVQGDRSWILFNIRAPGETCSTFMEERIEGTRGKNRDEKERVAGKNTRSHLHKHYEVGVLKSHHKNRENLCSILPVFVAAV